MPKIIPFNKVFFFFFTPVLYFLLYKAHLKELNFVKNRQSDL